MNTLIKMWTITLTGIFVVLSSLSVGSATELKEVKLALPFPNGVAWPHLSVAQKMGYFKDEGLKVEILSLNGSAASYKALVSGQADFVFTQPAQELNGLAYGEKTVSIYTAYEGHVFQFATLADSPYKHIADLKGQKIGISAMAGGQYPYLLATLKNAGLSAGAGGDVEIAEVGRGGAAAVALKDKRIAAYSASFVDMMAIELKGLKLRRFHEGPTSTFISDSLVTQQTTLKNEPQVAIGLARAIAKGTVFCFRNPNACWTIIAEEVPDTAKNPKFTKPLLKAVLTLHKLPEEAHGQWGYQPPVSWKNIESYLIDSGQLKKKVDIRQAFTNRYIGEINKFDKTKVEKMAANYK